MNATGLTGEYDVVLRWNPDPVSPSVDPSLPSSLPIALREQLGLTLESCSQPVDVLVIDTVDRPSEKLICKAGLSAHERLERSERLERLERFERFERPERPERFERFERFERSLTLPAGLHEQRVRR